ncbi:glycosyltransferase family 39 protein [Methanolobus sp. ZRKC2]|uniref:ArnT family glycosyltransferase n=1 Tax=Methanolobus sp. ZRKC2 TaxID=3125783 RepID=UPI00324F5827
MQNKKDYLFFIPIFLFVLLATIRLANPLQFWVDELFHVFAAISMLENGQPILSSGLPYERSFPTTWLASESFKLFGISEVSARLPFMIIGVLSIIATYYLIKNTYDKKTAILTTLLLSFAPLQIHWSLNARMYILLQLLYVFFLFVLYIFSREIMRGLESREFNEIKVAFFTFLLIGIVWFTSFVHQFYILFVATGLTFFVYLTSMRLLDKKKIFNERDFLISFVIVISLVLIFIRILFLNTPFLTTFAPIGMRSGIGFYVFLIGKHFTVLSLFAALSIIMLSKKDNCSSIIVIGYFIPFILLTLFLEAKNSRYLFFAFPLFIAIASNGIIEVWRNIKSNKSDRYKAPTKYLLILLVSILVIQTGIGLYHETFHTYQPIPYEDPHPHWRFASDYVKQNIKDDDIVLSTMPICTQYYLGETDYWLRQNEYYSFEDDEGILRDRYTGAIILKDYETFRIEMEGKNGWLIADRKLDSYFTDPQVLDFVNQNMTFVPEGSDETINVYRFEYNQRVV